MSDLRRIWWCEEHRSVTGDVHIDGVSRCYLAVTEGLWVRACRFVEWWAGPLPVVPSVEAIEAAIRAQRAVDDSISEGGDGGEFESMEAALLDAFAVQFGKEDT